MKPLQRAILLGALISLTACTASKDSVLRPDGRDIKTIYEAHLTDIGLDDRDAVRAVLQHRPLSSGEVDLNGYVRDAFNELDAHFPRLPNPTLVLYVFPHLVGEERVPVPGYATTFPLFRQVEYALPGELDVAVLRSPTDD